MNIIEPAPGLTATLKVPYLGYTRIELISKQKQIQAIIN